jgi:hypothetical protein
LGGGAETLSRLLFLDGVFHVALSYAPGIYAKLLSIVGIEADRQHGLHYLAQCTAHGGIRQHYAAVVISLCHLQLGGDIKKATDTMNSAFAPSLRAAPLYHWILSIASWRMCEP